MAAAGSPGRTPGRRAEVLEGEPEEPCAPRSPHSRGSLASCSPSPPDPAVDHPPWRVGRAGAERSAGGALTSARAAGGQLDTDVCQFHEETTVRFSRLSEELLWEYIDSGEPM